MPPGRCRAIPPPARPTIHRAVNRPGASGAERCVPCATGGPEPNLPRACQGRNCLSGVGRLPIIRREGGSGRAGIPHRPRECCEVRVDSPQDLHHFAAVSRGPPGRPGALRVPVTGGERRTASRPHPGGAGPATAPAASGRDGSSATAEPGAGRAAASQPCTGNDGDRDRTTGPASRSDSRQADSTAPAPAPPGGRAPRA